MMRPGRSPNIYKDEHMYVIGDIIRIIWVDGEPEYAGKTGIIESIDNRGQFKGSWGELPIRPYEDAIELVGWV